MKVDGSRVPASVGLPCQILTISAETEKVLGFCNASGLASIHLKQEVNVNNRSHREYEIRWGLLN